MGLELGAQSSEQTLQVVRLGIACTVHSHDGGKQLVDPRELASQRVVVGADDVLAQLRDRRQAPVVAL